MLADGSQLSETTLFLREQSALRYGVDPLISACFAHALAHQYPADPPVAARLLEAHVCWMSERPVETGARLGVKQTTRWTRAILDEVVSVLDIDSLEGAPATGLVLNDLARVRLRLAGPLLVDPYAVNRTTGAFVLVDEATNETVGAGMILAATP